MKQVGCELTSGDSLDPDYIEQFRVGEKVAKCSGYKFPGIVVSVVKKLDDRLVYCVECTAAETAGMLHIFSHKQLISAE